MLITDLLDLETKAARLSARLDERSEIGTLWRQMVSVAEAASSLSLEDVFVRESDVLQLIFGEPDLNDDSQSVSIAAEIARVLLNPGDLMSDPEGVFNRAHRAGRLTSLVDLAGGGRASFADITVDEWSEARAFFCRAIPKIINAPGPISMKAISIGALVSYTSPERHPIAERIIFTAAENSMRRETNLSDPIVTPNDSALPAGRSSLWVFTPSLALSSPSFRAWSPETKSGQALLIERLSRSLSREVGRLSHLDTWSSKARSNLKSPTKRSLLSPFCDLLHRSPVIDAAVIAKQLSCSKRAARNLIDQAIDVDALQPVINRSSYRVFAIPPMIRIMREKSQVRSTVAVIKETVDANVMELTAPKPRNGMSDDEMNAKMNDIMASLDDVLLKSNAVLERYARKKTPDDEY
jgi:hypothetical protein